MDVETPLVVVSPLSSTIKLATVTLTHAQIQSLNTSPVAFGDAPGVNRLLAPIAVAIIKNTTVGYNASPTVNVQFSGGVLVTGSAMALNAVSHLVTTLEAQITSAVFSTIENQAFRVISTANVTGGAAANTLKIVVVYFAVERA